MRYCLKCVQPDTRPGIRFDQTGVCPACRYFESLKDVDWNARRDELKQLANQLKSPNADEYDCIIGVSGGKDSTRQALYARNVLGLRPLLVCLGYPPIQSTQRGVDNLSNLINLGFDCLLVQPAPETWRQVMRKAFLRFANWCKATEYPLYASVPRIATAYQIRLVLWGENPALQLGDQNTMGKNGWDGNSVKNMNTLSGGEPLWMFEEQIERRRILQYFYPSSGQMDRAGLQIVYLGYFWPDWSLIDNACYSIVYGLEIRQEDPLKTGDPYGVTSIDEDWTVLNQMIKYYKFGFGLTTDYANEQIRKGSMSREDGIELVSKYDGLCSEEYIKPFCEYIDISMDEFWRIVNANVNQNLFYRSAAGCWIPKFKVGRT